MESILSQRMANAAKENKWLSQRQHGFASGKSTETATHVLCSVCLASSCAPFLWNVLIDGVLRLEFPFLHDLIGYSDDLVLTTTDDDPLVATQNLQLMCGKIVSNLKDLLLEVNASKTVFILFRRTWKCVPSLSINSTKINESPSTKYLGFTLDSELKWRPHINEKIIATKRLIFGLRRYTHLNWGLDTIRLKCLQRAYFTDIVIRLLGLGGNAKI